MKSLSINGKSFSIEAQDEMPLLWAIRDIIGLTGTKFGCGVSQCGACSVLIDGNLTKSCSIPVSYAEGKEIFTIEGSSENLDFFVIFFEIFARKSINYNSSITAH